MEYRFLGRSGLKVSALSLGAWVTYGGQVGEQIAIDCMTAAYEAESTSSTTPRPMPKAAPRR